MAWILEHLQIIVFVAGAIAYWLNQRAREKAGEQADYDGDGVPEAPVRPLTPASRDGSDPEQDERVRRIQEEIRRKIAERQGRSPAPAPEPGPDGFDPLRDLMRPVFGEEPTPEPPPFRPEPPPAPAYSASADADQAALERQRRLAEQLEELENRRAAARQAAEAIKRPSAYALPASDPANQSAQSDRRQNDGSVREALASPRALRRAFVLREVLDRPVALR